MKKYCLFMVLVAFISFGCKQRVVTQPETAPQQKEQKSEVAPPVKSPEKVTEPVVTADVKSLDKKDGSADLKGKDDLFKDVLFDYDKYDVRDEFKPLVKSVSEWMLKNTEARLSIEGHCDERGTNEYNLALGDRRAKAVRDYLVSLGVPSSKIDILSYGEEKALCTEQTEECWTKNRRAHFVVITKAVKG